MDVVGGVIVAAQSKNSSSASQQRLAGIKRSSDMLEDSGSKVVHHQQTSWRVKSEPPRGWRSSSMFRRVKSGCEEEFNNDLRSVLSCAAQSAAKGGSLGSLRPSQSLPSGNNGIVGRRDAELVKTETVTNFEGGSVNSSSISDGSLFFWTSAPNTYGSCLLKPPDPYLCTTMVNDPDMSRRNSDESEREKSLFGDSGLSLSSRAMAEHSVDAPDGEPPPKRATRSSQVPCVNAAAQKQEGPVGSAVSGRATWSSSTTFADGFSSESSRALLAPFYRSTNAMFSKPVRWVEPLRVCLKKELTVTDVGELGRIILPKRRGVPTPHLDCKEGKLLTMEDYNSNRHWTLRYKWWPNNKSRMYVLESTGEFVKYHDLKEKDELIVYKDGLGKLVIRGQKYSNNTLLRSDSFLGPAGLKGKSTGKRSPKGVNGRSIYKGSSTASSSSSAQATPNQQAVDTSPKQEPADGLDCKLGRTQSLINALGNTVLDAGEDVHSGRTSPGYSDGLTKVVDTTSQDGIQPKLSLSSLDCGMLSSVLSTSVLYVEQAEIGSYGAVAVHSDGGIDWEKLPDPPAIEFPGEFECTWGDCI